MKKIALIIPQLCGGGAERVAANLSLALSEKYEVHLIVFDVAKIDYPHGGLLHDLHVPPSPNIIIKATNVIRRAARAKKIKRQNKITCSVSFLERADLVNVLSSTGEFIVTSARNHMSKLISGHKLPLYKALLRFIVARSDKVVAVSQGVMADLRDFFRVPEDKLAAIYNPCDRAVLQQATYANPIQLPSGNAIITIGRLEPQKGQWHLIRAVSEVRKSFPDVKLYIVGNGGLKDKLQQLIDALALGDNVKLLGYMKAPHTCFKFCDIFVSCSEFEGMTNVILEAMAFGMPCVATDCRSGSREIMAPGTEVQEILPDIEYTDHGILTSVCGPGDFDAVSPLTQAEWQLVRAITEMLGDTEMRERYSKKSFERIKAFSPEKIAEDWCDLIGRA